MRQEVQPLRCTRVLGLTLLLFAVLFSTGCGSSLLDFCRPRPHISSLNPSSVPAGSADFPLVITGSDFHTDSTVKLNGVVVTSTIQSATQMSALVTAAQVAKAGTISVVVHSPAGGGSPTNPTGCGGGDSNTATLTITP